MLVCFMGGMVLSAKAEEKEPLIIEMLNKRDKEKMLYSQDVGTELKSVKLSYGHQTQRVTMCNLYLFQRV